MEFATTQKIKKLSKMYNYFGSRTAIKLLSAMSEEEKKIALSDSQVQTTILRINDSETLKNIFRKSPTFFQEVMFSNQETQDLLISTQKELTRKKLFDNDKKGYTLPEKSARNLEIFVRTIKSPKVFELLIENKFFQLILAQCSYREIKPAVFRNIDVVKLFNNMTNDPEIYDNGFISRKRNILKMFNFHSGYILLTEDYDKVIPTAELRNFIHAIKYYSKSYKKLHIDERTLSMFSTEMIDELLSAENVDTSIIEEFLKNGILPSLRENNYNFKRIFTSLLPIQREELILINHYDGFNNIDFIYFKIIIEECKKNELVKNKFINFIYSILFNQGDLIEPEQSLIKEELFRRISTNSISKEDYQKLFSHRNPLKTVFYLKFGKTSTRMDRLNGISLKQLIYLNVKHINQILKLLKLENEDELSIIYSTAIKLYLVFGLERSLKILNSDYGELDRTFFDNLSSIDVSRIELKKEGSKFIPELKMDFIRFMFANPKTNHFTDMFNDKTSLLYKNWGYLYNNFDELKEKCHGIITLKKLNIIFKQMSPSRDLKDVTPDNYRLNENGILNDLCLGNKTRYSNEEVYKSLLDIYEEMKKRTESSIPYIKGEAPNGYTYEMMKLNDPIVFTLGYKGDCCIRVKDIAHNHLLHATLCRNGRILLIYDENRDLAAFSPLKRNGEVLIANSIECANKVRNPKAIEAFSSAMNKIVTVSSSNPEDLTPISLVCIGTAAYAKPSGSSFPPKIKVPTIFEKEDNTYSDTDCYHLRLDIIYKKTNLDLTNIQYGDPVCSYKDPRPPIKACKFYDSSDVEIGEALKVVNAVRYANCELEDLEDFRLCQKYGIRECLYNDDWYILITNTNAAYGEYLSYDERAKTEYIISLNELKKQLKTGLPGIDEDSGFIKKLKI